MRRVVMSKALAGALVASASAWSPVTAAAQEVDGWRVVVEPNAYVPLFIDGTASVRERSVDVHTSIADMLENLDGFFEIRGEAWFQRFGFLAETSYMSVGLHTQEERFTLGTELFVGDLLAAARAWSSLEGRPPSEPGLAVDLLAGARLVRLDVDLAFSDQSRQASADLGRVMAGLRVPIRFSELFGAEVRASVAAPGPDWYVQALGEITVPFVAFRLGYRVSRFQLGGDDSELRMIGHGPYLGIALRLEEHRLE